MNPLGQKDFDGEERPVNPERPNKRERLLSALPLAFVFFILMLPRLAVPKFDEMFREMELGDLPRTTQFLLAVYQQPVFSFLFAPAMLLVASVHFMWACRERVRMLWFSCSVGFAGLVLLFFVMCGFVLPLISIVEKIGGGAR